MISKGIDALAMAFRVIAICIGGYAFTSAAVALLGMFLHAIGAPLNDAMLASVLLGYIFYIVVVMWGFVDQRTLIRPISIVGAAALTMASVSYLAPGALGL